MHSRCISLRSSVVLLSPFTLRLMPSFPPCTTRGRWLQSMDKVLKLAALQFEDAAGKVGVLIEPIVEGIHGDG
jgi:hypothetical protein